MSGRAADGWDPRGMRDAVPARQEVFHESLSVGPGHCARVCRACRCVLPEPAAPAAWRCRQRAAARRRHGRVAPCHSGMQARLGVQRDRRQPELCVDGCMHGQEPRRRAEQSTGCQLPARSGFSAPRELPLLRRLGRVLGNRQRVQSLHGVQNQRGLSLNWEVPPLFCAKRRCLTVPTTAFRALAPVRRRGLKWQSCLR